MPKRTEAYHLKKIAPTRDFFGTVYPGGWIVALDGPGTTLTLDAAGKWSVRYKLFASEDEAREFAKGVFEGE
jgi:hypothetical protein